MRWLLLPFVVSASCLAQTVLPGLGNPYSAYVRAYGPPMEAGDTLIDAQERVWKVSRPGTLSDVKMEVHAFFRAGKSVEERWVRPGKDLWTKEELWQILDGKAPHFRLVRRTEGVPSPYQALDNSNGLMYFVVPNGSYGAQLQRSARGPLIRIATREWASTLAASGFGLVQRKKVVASLRKEAPRWGGLRRDDVQSYMEKLVKGKDKSKERTWLLPSGAGEITWRTSGGTGVTVLLKDAKAWKDWTSAGSSREIAKLEVFRRFGTLSHAVLPKLVGNVSWRVERIEGSYPKFSPSGALRLLETKGEGEDLWKLDLGPEGYLLQVEWPIGAGPQ
ncbi:MAG: hypothetical protein RL318_1490 [Fibrobacterota bacterium]|jgi:hypothetical protein